MMESLQELSGAEAHNADQVFRNTSWGWYIHRNVECSKNLKSHQRQVRFIKILDVSLNTLSPF